MGEFNIQYTKFAVVVRSWNASAAGHVFRTLLAKVKCIGEEKYEATDMSALWKDMLHGILHITDCVAYLLNR